MEPVSKPKKFLRCPGCRSPINVEQITDNTPVKCSYCDNMQEIILYPEFHKRMERVQQDVVSTGATEAGCFHHAHKRAVCHCDQCGRFLCSLCDLKIGDMHLCPQCASSGKKKGKLSTLKRGAVLYDKIALALAVYPVITLFGIYLTIITAPMSLFFTVRYWNKQESILTRSKIRFVVAGILSLLQIVGWVAGIYYISTRLPGWLEKVNTQ
ncbi:MAG: hypothetical protein HQK83_20260 [Fibrobacteria bacterium]|nr:hypothetical protein [Fibrobacteria bacterium]